jgi:exodeoxyribonuclease III
LNYFSLYNYFAERKMKILSWNVAGLRAVIKKGALDFILETDYDIICFQETKAIEAQVTLSDEFKQRFPYRVWGENHGETQRKGLSGTSIWSRIEPIRRIPTMELDTEGRITALEFPDFNLVTVYTPNSQSLTSKRCMIRTALWDPDFEEYLIQLNEVKPTIVCGDFNVANLDIDIYNPDKYRDCIAGFLNIERKNFQQLLKQGFVDIFRDRHPDEKECYTFWDQTRPHMRLNNKGWRLDYFLVSTEIGQVTKDCTIHSQKLGSDHCPISIEI